MPHEKFMFNQNIFDEPEEDEEEFAEPPAPTFSEEELEAVRQETYKLAYNKGKEDGLEESRISREQKIANVLAQISEDTQTIFKAEEERERIFEQESLRLSLAGFYKAFPSLKKHLGEEEFYSILKTIIEKQSGQSKIRITVAVGIKNGVEEFLKGLNINNSDGCVFEVQENERLEEGACALSWADGGAIRDIEALSSEILSVLEEALAGKAITGHDSNEGFSDNDSINHKSADDEQQRPENEDLGDHDE